MALPIEDYGLIGNMHTVALIGRNGSIDWLCTPRFDSAACFAALLGNKGNGRWLVAPEGDIRASRRRYRDQTLILETEFETENGVAVVTDFMPVHPQDRCTDLVRLVTGVRGKVAMRTELIFRFDYGYIVPWVRQRDYGLHAVAGPDGVFLRTPVALEGDSHCVEARFTVDEGETIPFTLSRTPSQQAEPPAVDPLWLLGQTERWWREWVGRCRYQGRWREPVVRSLITLKALTYDPTGGIVAAATTSLPEKIGGVRNWDYRYCWIRDASFTLRALLISGFTDEAHAWRDWLLRAVAGKPSSQLNILYGLSGERRLIEQELDWLDGYEGSRPVRTGNEAFEQFQLDIYGEVMNAFEYYRSHSIEPDDDAWRVQKALIEALENDWRRPDNGIWEMRAERKHFTHSKVMAWVAVDRVVKGVERHGLAGPVEHWRALRDAIHAEVCENGFDRDRNAFVQYYGGTELDASLLMIPLVGFLPATDPRVVATTEAIERELTVDGLVLRYATETEIDGLPPGEGSFIACSFWLADALALIGRRDDAEALFERLLSLRDDLGLLAEEYDPKAGRQLGNFPQAFSHVGLINTASILSGDRDIG